MSDRGAKDVANQVREVCKEVKNGAVSLSELVDQFKQFNETFIQFLEKLEAADDGDKEG